MVWLSGLHQMNSHTLILKLGMEFMVQKLSFESFYDQGKALTN